MYIIQIIQNVYITCPASISIVRKKRRIIV